MSGGPRGRFRNLDQMQRKALADYLSTRIDYLRAERKYTQLLLDALQDPARGDNKRLRRLVSDVLAPARRRMRVAQLSALTEAADVNVLAEMVPPIVGSMARAVDIPMLFAALNVDNDLTDQIVSRAMPIVKRMVAGISQNRRAG